MTEYFNHEIRLFANLLVCFDDIPDKEILDKPSFILPHIKSDEFIVPFCKDDELNYFVNSLTSNITNGEFTSISVNSHKFPNSKKFRYAVNIIIYLTDLNKPIFEKEYYSMLLNNNVMLFAHHYIIE